MIIISMQVRTTERENTTVILSIITLTPVPLLTGTWGAMFGLGGGVKLENFGPFLSGAPLKNKFRRFSCENKTSQE